jgi:hypothetical protein
VLNRLRALGERFLHRAADEVHEHADEEQHVGELEDPARNAEVGLLGVTTTAGMGRLLGMRLFVRFGFSTVRGAGAGGVVLREERRRDNQEKEEKQAAHQTGLPRMRSAAR